MNSEQLIEIVIRYDGKDADNHVINLHSLGESIQGAARIISTCAHFLVDFEYVKQMQAHNVLVVAKEPEANCFEISVVIKEALQSNMFSGIGAAALTAIVSYIISKQSNSKEEMKSLKEVALKALEMSIAKDDKTNERLVSTLDKMATGLLPASRKAVSPIGMYCDTLKIGDETAVPIDKAKKDAILSTSEEEVTRLRQFDVLITELDLENNTGKVRLDGDRERRINAAITDPMINTVDNTYAKALAQGDVISVQAKAAILDGEITRLYISDIITV